MWKTIVTQNIVTHRCHIDMKEKFDEKCDTHLWHKMWQKYFDLKIWENIVAGDVT